MTDDESSSRKWDIKVTQIECTSPDRLVLMQEMIRDHSGVQWWEPLDLVKVLLQTWPYLEEPTLLIFFQQVQFFSHELNSQGEWQELQNLKRKFVFLVLQLIISVKFDCCNKRKWCVKYAMAKLILRKLIKLSRCMGWVN